jgi:hypothetical protein
MAFVTAIKFVSFPQNAEDVILCRALQSIPTYSYIGVDVPDPVHLSVTNIFYENGSWGIDFESVENWSIVCAQTAQWKTIHQFGEQGLASKLGSLRNSGFRTAFHNFVALSNRPPVIVRKHWRIKGFCDQNHSLTGE